MASTDALAMNMNQHGKTGVRRMKKEFFCTGKIKHASEKGLGAAHVGIFLCVFFEVVCLV